MTDEEICPQMTQMDADGGREKRIDPQISQIDTDEIHKFIEFLIIRVNLWMISLCNLWMIPLRFASFGRCFRWIPSASICVICGQISSSSILCDPSSSADHFRTLRTKKRENRPAAASMR